MALWRLHVDVPDQPGRLGELATTVGAAGADIVSLHVVGEPAADGAVTDELLLHLPDGAPVRDVVRAAEADGFRCPVVVRADASALADPVTTALALARCVVADPGSAPRAVAALLRAELTGDGGPPVAHRAEVAVGRLRVAVGRAWPFTAAEISHAAGLLELAGSAALGRAGAEPAARLREPALAR